jgi:hypothetical protein
MAARDRTQVVFLVILAILLAGCSSRTTVRWKTLEDPFADIDEGRSWVGHTRAELIEVWGKPTTVTKDAEGGEVLVYRTARKVAYSVETEDGVARPTPVPGEPEHGMPDPVGPGRTKYRMEDKEIGRFWVDAEGKIYRYTMDHKLFEKGEHDPPKPILDFGD